MPSARRLPLQVLEQIQGARNRLVRSKVLVGFDGFVDTILHVVKTRESTTKYSRMEKMSEFAERIGGAAGLSTNMEMVTQMVKLGGNGPIMANALSAYSAPVTYIGNLGSPSIHPVFADLAKRATVQDQLCGWSNTLGWWMNISTVSTACTSCVMSSAPRA